VLRGFWKTLDRLERGGGVGVQQSFWTVEGGVLVFRLAGEELRGEERRGWVGAGMHVGAVLHREHVEGLETTNSGKCR
jgi:hypothetical protein